MGKYLILWEIDISRVPEDPKGQFELFTRLLNMVKEDLKNGAKKDFGMFLGGKSGYSIHDGTEEEVAMNIMKYGPFVKRTVHQVISVDQIEEIMKKLANI